ncbi:hypothetical protein PINS_up004475 [Pythium insidiosum]|nr:hypothetical protein PINS_up004475 [Pythium insidiosum]
MDSSGYFYDNGGNSNSVDAEAYAAEYWALDAEAQAVCAELAPDAYGESVELSDLDELCRRMRRPLRDHNERLRLMTELDPDNVMRISRAAFTSWLLQDLYVERQLAAQRTFQRTDQVVPVATPSWEQVQELQPDGSSVTYYSNVLTGETAWELTPLFVHCLRQELQRVDELRALQAAGSVSQPEEQERPAIDALHDLRELFTRFDDDRSGALDASEFRDLCVAIGCTLGTGERALHELMELVDPFTAAPSVSWDALVHCWVSHAPFQMRTRLAPPLEAWERIESLETRARAPVYRHSTTLVERWSHPETEQRVVDLLLKLFPSTKLDWLQRIAMLFELHAKAATTPSPNTDATGSQDTDADADVSKPKPSTAWTRAQCRALLRQLGHACVYAEHLDAALRSLRERFGGGATNVVDGLDEATVTQWMLHCVGRVERDGWDELEDPTTGQTYFYHEVRGETQWDPPALHAQMATMMARFAGDTTSHEATIQRIFRHFDADESGSISFDEFQRLYVALFGRREGINDESSRERIRRVFDVLDTSGDGDVSLDEFMVWWKTKMSLQDEETEDARRQRRLDERKRVAIEFLQQQGALLTTSSSFPSSATDDNGGVMTFASNVLPRLVAVLGKYQLKGLAYRNALRELVRSMEQQIDLTEFLDWYDRFEAREREREELEAQKARALALLQAQEAEAKEKARKLKMVRKGQLLTKRIAAGDDSKATAEPPDVAWRRHVETLFKTFDRDGSGTLDAAELQALTHALGHAMDDKQVRQMLRAMDASGDERVSVDEFLKFWSAFQRRSVAKGKAAKANETKKEAEDSVKTKKETKKKQKKIADGSMMEATTALSVRLDLAKDKALRVSLGDMRDALSDWREALLERPRQRAAERQRVEDQQEELARLRRLREFVPTGTRRYAHVDVTWIEPEVVACVVDLIRGVAERFSYPLLRPDAAQRIQRIMRGAVTRMRMLRHVTTRFATHLDLRTRIFFYVDTEQRGVVSLRRPLFPTIVSADCPWELGDCRDKIECRQFVVRLREMQRKKAFSDSFAVERRAWTANDWATTRRLHVVACFVVSDVLERVNERVAGDVWRAIWARDLVLLALQARRRPRQLTVPSPRDATRPLPLHVVVRDRLPIDVVTAVFHGHHDALHAADACGRTPLHLAFRERVPRAVLELLLSRRSAWRHRASQRSVWELQSSMGETPLHVALRYRVELETLRWLLATHGERIPWRALTLRDHHGLTPFHRVIQTFDPLDAYARSVVLVLFRTWRPEQLCALQTDEGDTPLLLAIRRYAQWLERESRSTEKRDDEQWRWLVRTLTASSHALLTTRRERDDLLPLHTIVKASALPETLALEMYTATTAQLAADDERLRLPRTATTLLHFALLHRPNADALLLRILEDAPHASRQAMQPSQRLPLHLAVLHGSSVAFVSRLCELHPGACKVRDSEGRLPLHLCVTTTSTTTVGDSAALARVLLACCADVLSDRREREGLTALVMAASAKRPDVAVLLELLDRTPPQRLAADVSRRHVTPLYALSLRRCSDQRLEKVSGIVDALDAKFETLDDEDAYFVALAKAKHRSQHFAPTPQWPIPKILALMERHPDDEAVQQRALLAINQKLQRF